MSWLDGIVRPEILTLRGYQAADYEPGNLRLNANEAPWRAPGDDSPRGLNIYPPPRPQELAQALADHYGVAANQVLVTRGSSEAIDLLIRSFCTGGRDRVLICPPTFGMYQVYAAVQGAEVQRVPLIRERDFTLDAAAVNAAVDERVKLVFLCSPNNPTGNALDRAAMEAVCRKMDGRGLVVIDEAYIDFVAGPSLLDFLQRHRHVVLLRTLSKAYGLAGIRCGTLLAHADVVDVVTRVMPPYGIPTPCIDAALQSLRGGTLELMQIRVAGLLAERERMAQELASLPGVRRVYPSQANFLLIEADDAAGLQRKAHRAKILIRSFDGEPLLAGCLRISIGTAEHNDALLASLRGA